ncbi:putative integral membrane transport protein [Nostocoides japonicum T1-X7]|uniref:Putative integral membrane transport protein n=1 Tax=Nostocoides japonicum T1-X7 TaxID=1194083 RepID=A0A077M3X4_9MICO|nr:ABC transporter permease [Tetrasphaera japonica]CCH79742.1 putative integral membrane transport protein [Tetrasphaera japonica T1-X7]
MSLAAPPRQRILAQAGFETRTLLANGEQLLVAVVLPALALLGLALASAPDLGPGRRVDVATPGVLALAVISTAFTGQAIATGFDRRSGMLRLLGTTPLGRDGLLAGRFLGVLVVEGLQVVILGGIGLALGWRPDAAGLPLAVLWLLLGTATFVALALLLAGTLRAEGVLAIANLLWVLMLGLGVLLPIDRLPTALGAVARCTPGGALGELVRAATQGLATPWWGVGVLLGWLVLGTAGALRWFRWSD